MNVAAFNLGLLALTLVVLVAAWRGCRAAARTARSLLTGRRPEDVLTVVAAVIATTVQTTGMWKFFGNVLAVPPILRVALFSFIEVAVLASALRARRGVVESPTHTAGIDGKAVWGLTSASAVLSTLDAGSFAEVVFRLVVAGIAAWLWERSMSAERQRRTGRHINWRITPERVLVRLGVAEPTDRTATEVDAHRRLTRVALAAQHARTLTARDAWTWRQRRAARRLDAAMRAAVEHAGLAADESARDALLAQLAVLYNAASLAELTPDAPWAVPATRPPLRLITRQELVLAEAARVHREVHPGVPDAVPGEQPETAGEQPDEVHQFGQPDPVPAELEKLIGRARRRWHRRLGAGDVPSVRELKDALRIGQDRATAIKEHLDAARTSGRTPAVPEGDPAPVPETGRPEYATSTPAGQPS